jgi:hypothetical protein
MTGASGSEAGRAKLVLFIGGAAKSFAICPS